MVALIAMTRMYPLDNKIVLITYPDSMGANIRELHDLLDSHFAGAIGAIHLLPFFPSSGDRGFAPMRYDSIDRRFGAWDDFKSLAADYDVMVDYMINHISAQSEYYRDYLEKRTQSKYSELFLSYTDFWGAKGPSSHDVEIIYKRKPREPYVMAKFADGSEEKIWCTFSDEQIDINIATSAGRRFLEENLRGLVEHGAKSIRLDAFAYAVKKAGTSCFFVEPDVWDLLTQCKAIVDPLGAEILPEIHEHYSIQLKLADHGFLVYDFALPMLLLHAIYFGEASYLDQWYSICPRRQYTTLDTHDGIGIVDVKGLLPDTAIEATKEHLFAYGANVKKIYNTEAYNNLDIYQVNCTYYSALGDDDEAYLLARAVQFFSPGTPQVYYVGLLAGKNDLELLESTKEGRNINRHYYAREEVAAELDRPVVKKLRDLMRLRNAHPAFNGEFKHDLMGKSCLNLSWSTQTQWIRLEADFARKSYAIKEGHF